jgi:hypothetical protein
MTRQVAHYDLLAGRTDDAIVLLLAAASAMVPSAVYTIGYLAAVEPRNSSALAAAKALAQRLERTHIAGSHSSAEVRSTYYCEIFGAVSHTKGWEVCCCTGLSVKRR